MAPIQVVRNVVSQLRKLFADSSLQMDELKLLTISKKHPVKQQFLKKIFILIKKNSCWIRMVFHILTSPNRLVLTKFSVPQKPVKTSTIEHNFALLKRLEF